MCTYRIFYINTKTSVEEEEQIERGDFSYFVETIVLFPFVLLRYGGSYYNYFGAGGG
jgi:hypothetical protein